MTLKDASQFSGRRVIVAFSNGPDNASMVAPEDVRELAQTEGVPIYMISTQLARLDPVSTAVFGRMSGSTGGKSYFAKDWQDQARGLRCYSRRPGPSLYPGLLPPAEPEFRMEKYHRKAYGPDL